MEESAKNKMATERLNEDKNTLVGEHNINDSSENYNLIQQSENSLFSPRPVTVDKTPSMLTPNNGLKVRNQIRMLMNKDKRRFANVDISGVDYKVGVSNYEYALTKQPNKNIFYQTRSKD